MIAQLTALREYPGCSAGRGNTSGAEMEMTVQESQGSWSLQGRVLERRKLQRESEVQSFAEGTPQILFS